MVGLPLDGNGDDTPRALEARAIAAELEKRTGLPVRLVDERYTTAAALRAIREMGGSTRGRKGDVDALAATVLLQHALSLPREAPRSLARRRSPRCRSPRPAAVVERRHRARHHSAGLELRRRHRFARRARRRSRRRAVPPVRVARADATAPSRPGTYVLRAAARRGTSVLDALTRGKGLVHTVTIPEGFALASIAPLLGKALVGAARLGAGRRDATPRCSAASTSRRRRSRATSFPTRTRSPTARRPREAVRMLVARFERRVEAGVGRAARRSSRCRATTS